MQIRFALPEEADEIAKVLREAFAPFESFYTPEAFAATTPIAEKIRARFEEKGAIWVASENEKIIATVSVVPDGARLYIRSMAVLPQAQGSGVGRKLLEAVEIYAAQDGFEKLFLYTVPFLDTAIRLYEQHGFERGATETEGFFGTSWFAMEKKL